MMDERRLAERQAFAEDMGMMWERMGTTRMFGRVFGALLVAVPPEMSAGELAEFLQASRGAISQATRQLVHIRLIERVRRTGERKDFFRVRPHAWSEATRQQMSAMTRIVETFRGGLIALEGAPSESRRALEESIAFMEFWERESVLILDRWLAQTEHADGNRHSDI